MRQVQELGRQQRRIEICNHELRDPRTGLGEKVQRLEVRDGEGVRKGDMCVEGQAVQDSCLDG